MFLKESNNSNNEIINVLESSDLETNGMIIIMESTEYFQNIIVDIMKIEHRSIISENMEILNEGVKETVDRLLKMIKDAWIKISEWFKQLINTSEYKIKAVRSFVDKNRAELKKFDGKIEVEMKTYNMPLLRKFSNIFGIAKNYEISTSYLKDVPLYSLNDEIVNIIKEKIGKYDTLQDFRDDLRTGSKTIEIDKSKVDIALSIIDERFKIMEETKRHYDLIKMNYDSMIKILDSFQIISPKDGGDKNENDIIRVKALKVQSDAYFKLYMIYVSFSMEVLISHVNILKKVLNNIK